MGSSCARVSPAELEVSSLDQLLSNLYAQLREQTPVELRALQQRVGSRS